MKAKIRPEKWVVIDRQYGRLSHPAPFVVILDEGFDGLRIAVGTWEDSDVADLIRTEGDIQTIKRFDTCDRDGLFHHWDRALEVKSD